MGGIGIWQLIIVAVIIILLFGTKKLRNLGGDLGSAIKGFKKAVGDEDKDNAVNVEKKSDSLADNSYEQFSEKESADVSKKQDKDQV